MRIRCGHDTAFAQSIGNRQSCDAAYASYSVWSASRTAARGLWQVTFMVRDSSWYIGWLMRFV